MIVDIKGPISGADQQRLTAVLSDDLAPEPSPSAMLFTTIGEQHTSRRFVGDPDTLYGFFYTDCIYESAYALVSLHRTKHGAWEACRKAQWDRWIEHLHGQHSGLHLRAKGERRGGYFDYHIYRQSDDYRVRPIKVTD